MDLDWLPIEVQLWVYRVGGYVLVNFLEDPGWMALLFC